MKRYNSDRVATPWPARSSPGQLCTVVPVGGEHLNVGDIVLCKVNGFQYLHLIKAIQGKRFQIGNNRGRINGWIGENGIYGKCVRIEGDLAPRCPQCVSVFYELHHR